MTRCAQFLDLLGDVCPSLPEVAITIEEIDVLAHPQEREVLALPVNVNQSLADALEDMERHRAAIDPANIASFPVNLPRNNESIVRMLYADFVEDRECGLAP